MLVIQCVYTALEEELGATEILYTKNLATDYIKIILWIRAANTEYTFWSCT